MPVAKGISAAIKGPPQPPRAPESEGQSARIAIRFNPMLTNCA